MSPIHPLTTITAISSATSPQGERHQRGHAPQAQGETFKAVVLEAHSNGRYLLDIGGKQLLASSQVPLTPGQSLHLQVNNSSPQIELKIVSDVFSALAGKSLVLLGKNIDLSSLFNSLQQGAPPLLGKLSPQSATTLETFFPSQLQSLIKSDEGGPFLQRLFNRLGFNLEALLASGNKEQAPLTLKAALLDIAHQFQGSERISEQAHKLLATLEVYQLAQLQLTHDKQLIFPLPLSFLEQGYLLVERNEKERQENADADQEKRFSLHLSLTGLGNMKIAVLQHDKDLYIRFDLESQEKADFVSSFEDDLKHLLSGLNIVSLTFSDKADDPTNELVRMLVSKEQSMLDTTV